MPVTETRRDTPAPRRICMHCGRLGHLARTCTNPARSHYKIGIEVEGYWRSSTWIAWRNAARDEGFDGTTDGSLQDYDADWRPFEWRTKPGHLGEALEQLARLYPEGTNSHAGMHVHVSFVDCTSISAMHSVEFFKFFRERMREWGTRMTLPEDHQFWHRLDGHNQYCRLNTEADLVYRIGDGDRYRQVNFTSWSGHATLEIRLLPMFSDLKVGASAVEELLAVVEDWLALDRLGDEVRPALPGLISLVEHRALAVDTESYARRGTATISMPEPVIPPRIPGHERFAGSPEQVRNRAYLAVCRRMGVTA